MSVRERDGSDYLYDIQHMSGLIFYLPVRGMLQDLKLWPDLDYRSHPHILRY